MTGILDKYLKAHGLTRYQLAKKSGINQTTWFNVNLRPIDRWTVKQVQALATSTGVSLTTVLLELEEISNTESDK
ncbi:XRE family transcriptional regulator [Pediococcus acidilactici]